MQEHVVTPVILCGGGGTRLWPLSNSATPKQFLKLGGDMSMLTQTAERVKNTEVAGLSFGDVLAIGAARHEALLRQHLPDARLLLEPFGRNSAAAVVAAALVSDPDDILLILPADHHIAFPDRFHEAIAAGLSKASDGHVVTFGIEPTFASTGYGYIELEDGDARVRQARRFVEKPDRDTAAAYIETGRYVWNAGIFLFRASAMIEAFQRLAPDILTAVKAALPERPRMDAEKQIVSLDRDAFAASPSISVDYAIMEKLSPIFGVPLEMGWSDVGDYKALWELSVRDGAGNAQIGPVELLDTENCYVRSEHLPIYMTGGKDMIVVANDKHIMICPIENAQDVKKLAQLSKKSAAAAPGLAEQARTILWDQFQMWGENAWDTDVGGFYECLDANGRPVEGAERRVRVAARQIFSFASSIELGWSDRAVAEDLVSKGLDYLLGDVRNPSGGWAHKTGADGKVTDPSEDLYDHAFIILAGATAYRVLSDERGLELALAALSHIEENWADPVHGGYMEGSAQTDERRANPHMHLLEALLALHAATSNPAHLKLAENIVVLFETTFFDARKNILREFYQCDWTPAEGERGQLFEPGHHYEWATLLTQFENISGRDLASWARRLISKAGSIQKGGPADFCVNVALSTGAIVDAKKRLWPQLEKLRAYSLHPDAVPPEAVAELFRKIKETYLDPAGRGLLIDEVGEEGQPLDKPVPASMLYHMVTAFAPFLKA
ncbi:AGE family epimerase/isomerase [Henriciella litoralis]|uniref:AGE family epimerase/isomerase n=1 Tax=Henriciella litoralis TaxID=568102 RepID=UPI000A05CEDA|nr:AGE family epimerase/isomerase [Henriciella litoralis]